MLNPLTPVARLWWRPDPPILVVVDHLLDESHVFFHFVRDDHCGGVDEAFSPNLDVPGVAMVDLRRK